MTIARCRVNGCKWEYDCPDEPTAARMVNTHVSIRHPAPEPAQTTAKVEPPIQQLSSVDWWTRAIDVIAAQPPGSRFTLYEICAHLDEPPSTNGWQSLARDAHHLGLIDDVGGVNSKRPGTKGSKTTLWERTRRSAPAQHRQAAS